MHKVGEHGSPSDFWLLYPSVSTKCWKNLPWVAGGTIQGTNQGTTTNACPGARQTTKRARCKGNSNSKDKDKEKGWYRDWNWDWDWDWD